MTLDIITDDTLGGTTHGFFTRVGGASSGVFDGLNCGYGSSDQQDIVKMNRNRVAKAMNIAPDALMGVHQIHSADVVTVKKPSPDRARADGMVTNVPGIALSILTADCQPVLFADATAGVIGAAHAGWKGAIDGVLENTVTAMERLGAVRTSIKAVIGPCISQKAYEVGPEFAERFIDENADNARFFVNGKGDRYQFDLPGFGLAKLRDTGIAQAEWTRHCTYSDPDRFFSYRRSVHNKDADYGRLIAAIRL
jgi:YfiH family protein